MADGASPNPSGIGGEGRDEASSRGRKNPFGMKGENLGLPQVSRKIMRIIFSETV